MNRNPYNLVFLVSLVIGSFGLLFGIASAAPTCENVPGFVVVQTASLRVRSGAGTTFPTLRFVSRDDILPVLDAESDAGWWRVCPDGFVSAGYVRYEAAPTPTAIPATSAPPRATPTRIMLQRIYCMAGSLTQTAVEPGLTLIECQAAGVKP